MIKFPSLSVTFCTFSRCKQILISGYVAPLFLTIPSILSFQITTEVDIREDGSCAAYYSIQIPSFDGSDLLFSLNMLFYSFFLKLLPCAVLTVLTACLIQAMYQVERNLLRLRGNTVRESSQQDERNIPMRLLSHQDSGNLPSRKKRQNDLTTRLLIGILVLFIIAEFPLSFLGLLSALLGKQFFLECYDPMGELMDMLTVTNCSINFILYCLMSSQFRTTLKKIIVENFQGLGSTRESVSTGF